MELTHTRDDSLTALLVCTNCEGWVLFSQLSETIVHLSDVSLTLWLNCNRDHSEELLAFLKKRRGLLDGVAITGGEPLLRPELPALLEKIKALGYAIKLDTNGAFPEQLEAVVRAGLADYVAMDVKNSPVRYAQTVGAVELDLTPIDKSVSFLLRDTVDYEFRTTAVAEIHDDASFLSLADWLAGARRYYIQRFQPRDTVLRAGLSAPSEMQLHCWAELVRPKIPAVEIRGI